MASSQQAMSCNPLGMASKLTRNARVKWPREDAQSDPANWSLNERHNEACPSIHKLFQKHDNWKFIMGFKGNKWQLLKISGWNIERLKKTHVKRWTQYCTKFHEMVPLHDRSEWSIEMHYLQTNDIISPTTETIKKIQKKITEAIYNLFDRELANMLNETGVAVEMFVWFSLWSYTCIFGIWRYFKTFKNHAATEGRWFRTTRS